jgi:hypothetical protein
VLLSERGPHCAVTYDSFAAHIQLEPEKVYTDSALLEMHALREKEVREEIAMRLRCVCSDFSHEDFDRLVRKMAERQLRDERRLVW